MLISFYRPGKNYNYLQNLFASFVAFFDSIDLHTAIEKNFNKSSNIQKHQVEALESFAKNISDSLDAKTSLEDANSWLLGKLPKGAKKGNLLDTIAYVAGN